MKNMRPYADEAGTTTFRFPQFQKSQKYQGESIIKLLGLGNTPQRSLEERRTNNDK
jgi:hypothetical protein